MNYIEVEYDKDSSHEEVIRQFVEKLYEGGFASKKEIVENLKMADILLDIDLKDEQE